MAMETEIVKARTRLPEPEERKKMRSNKRSQMYVIDPDDEESQKQGQIKNTRYSLFDE
jgi:hypothetical protein